MPELMVVLESVILSLMLSATFWNAVSGHAPVGDAAVHALILLTTTGLTAIFVLDELRNRVRFGRPDS